MNLQRHETFSEALVGLFMVVVIGLLAYFTIILSGANVLSGRNRVKTRIAFEQVGGLKAHDNVMFRGTKVGVVSDVEVTPSNLVVVAEIDRNVTLKGGYRISVRNLSMLGGNYLLLEEGDGAQLDLEKTLFKGETPTDWMQDVAEISRNLREISNMQELRTIVTNANAVTAKAVIFADKANAVADKADAIADEASTVAKNAEEIVARVNRGEGTMGRLLSADDTLYRDASNTLATASQVMDKMNRAKMFDDLEAGIAAFRKAAEGFDSKATFDRANELLANLNVVAERLKNGQGTLGRLSTDEKLYAELDGLIRDVRQIIDNYRDTTPITTFSSLATGAL